MSRRLSCLSDDYDGTVLCDLNFTSLVDIAQDLTVFMRPYILTNSNVHNFKFLWYNLTIIIVIWQRKEFYDVSISEILVRNIQTTNKIPFNINVYSNHTFVTKMFVPLLRPILE